MRQDLDVGEDLRETVPLCFELLAALGDGEGIGEGCVVGPESQFLFGRLAGEEIENASYNGLLLGGKVDTSGSGGASMFNLDARYSEFSTEPALDFCYKTNMKPF